MTARSSHEVTQLLQAWSDGEQGALQELIPLVYGEMHRLAKRYMAGERPGHTLQTTALVNEAYLKLVDSNHMNWRNRAHFFAVAAQLMRRILIDFARSRPEKKPRGGTAFLWRAERRGNRRGAEGFRRHRDERLEAGQDVASARTSWGETRWSRNVGARLSRYFGRRWSARRTSGPLLSKKPQPGAYYILPALGGPERKLANAYKEPGGSGVSWSPDGKYLAVADCGAKQNLPAGIFFISVENGERRESKIELPASYVTAPSFSPDGKYLAFISGPGPLSCDVYVAPVSGGKPRALTSVHAYLNGVAWTPDGRQVVFDSNHQGLSTLSFRACGPRNLMKMVSS